jgi:hypothetical protein
MEAIKDHLTVESIDQSASARKRWSEPVVEVHDAEELTMAAASNTNDAALGSS